MHCPQLQVWRTSLAKHVGDMGFSWEFMGLLLIGEHEQILPTPNISAIALLAIILDQIWKYHSWWGTFRPHPGLRGDWSSSQAGCFPEQLPPPSQGRSRSSCPCPTNALSNFPPNFFPFLSFYYCLHAGLALVIFCQLYSILVCHFVVLSVFPLLGKLLQWTALNLALVDKANSPSRISHLHHECALSRGVTTNLNCQRGLNWVRLTVFDSMTEIYKGFRYQTLKRSQNKPETSPCPFSRQPGW